MSVGEVGDEQRLGRNMNSGSPMFDTVGLMGRRCVVLGAGGFLGQSLVRALARIGAEVTGVSRKVEHLGKLAPGVRWIAGRLEDPGLLQMALADQEFVFHLVGATLPAESNLDPAGDVATNLLPTIALLEAVRLSGRAKVVFASSGGTVYGIPRTIPISEDAATDPITAYGISKLAVEKYLELFRRLYGLDYQILRIANAYGPGQSPFRGQGVVAAMLYRILRNEPIELWGDGAVVRDFVHVDDIASAFLRGALYRGSQRVLNVGSGEGRSLLSVVQDLMTLQSDYRHPITFRDGRTADVAINVLNCDLIARELGWRPLVTWPDGIRSTAAWMRQTIRST